MAARPAVVSWSGGKDSCLALMRVASRLDVRAALTMFDEAGSRSRSHGLRRDVVAAQVARLGLAHVVGTATWAGYTDAFVQALGRLAGDGVRVAVFGDIFEDTHRAWCEDVAARAGLAAELPLWGEDTGALAREFLARGGAATFVTVRTPPLTRDWLGRAISAADLDTLAARGADPGGERGEYHTVVTDCPLFSAPVVLDAGALVQTGDCWAIDLIPAAPAGAGAAGGGASPS